VATGKLIRDHCYASVARPNLVDDDVACLHPIERLVLRCPTVHAFAFVGALAPQPHADLPIDDARHGFHETLNRPRNGANRNFRPFLSHHTSSLAAWKPIGRRPRRGGGLHEFADRGHQRADGLIVGADLALQFGEFPGEFAVGGDVLGLTKGRTT